MLGALTPPILVELLTPRGFLIKVSLPVQKKNDFPFTPTTIKSTVRLHLLQRHDVAWHSYARNYKQVG